MTFRTCGTENASLSHTTMYSPCASPDTSDTHTPPSGRKTATVVPFNETSRTRDRTTPEYTVRLRPSVVTRTSSTAVTPSTPTGVYTKVVGSESEVSPNAGSVEIQWGNGFMLPR